MQPWTVFPRPVPSYPQPIDLVTIDPDVEPTVCIQVNESYIPLIIGSLLQLLNQFTWGDATQADIILQQQRVNTLIYLFQIAGGCPAPCPPTIDGGGDCDDMSQLEQFVIIDGKCRKQIRCCIDDPWTTLADLGDVQSPGQPGGGTPQPQPGQTMCYDASFTAANKWWLPVLVSTDDTISIAPGRSSGSGNDGTDSTLYCPNGAVYSAGNCNTGGAHPVGGDPLSGKPHMCFIINIDGTYYQIADLTVTVPSGVSNSQAWIQVNDSTLSDNSGSYFANVCIKNNQAGTWTHTFDFTVNDGSWVATLNSGQPLATWLASTGWSYQDIISGSFAQRIVEINRSFTSTNITSIDVEFDLTKGTISSTSNLCIGLSINGTLVVNSPFSAQSSGANQHFIYAIAAAMTSIDFVLNASENNSSTSDGSCLITRMVITGTGIDPF